CLENLFSRLRAIGVSNDHPTGIDCINRLRLVVLGQADRLDIDTTAVQMEVKHRCLKASSDACSRT
ncbi:Putative LOC100575639, partial [Caligus rogercresseyi]